MQKTAGLSAFPNICFATHQRIPAGTAVLIMVAILLTAPGASAGTLSGPSSTSANSFTLTWSVSPPAPPPFAWDSGTHAATLEENGNSISPGSGSVTLSRPSGTYNYRIEKCSWYYYYGYTTTCDSATKTVTVSNQPAVPPSVTAFSNSCTSTAVHWGAVASNVSQYRVYEQVNGGSWSQVYAGSRKTASSPLILNRSAQTTYRYRVRADYSAAGYSAVSGYRYSSSIVTPICDADADGVADGTDQCPNTPVGETANVSGCSPSQLDSDGDGVTDAADQCPATPVGESVDTDGCAASQLIPIVEQPPAPVLPSVPAAPTQMDQARAIPAEFNVTPSGQATYSIPILAAPGTAGLVPNISLNYNSGAGNGIAGLGWSLSGLSSISRCRQTYGQDKNAAPITWTDQDRFCWNGERLLVTSGTYGYPGSTYKTEIDSYARITAIGGTAGHPDYFKVEQKDGIIEYYGQTIDSKWTLSSDDPRVIKWAINKKQDSAGNDIDYTYVNLYLTQRVDNISYAYANGSASANIKFTYGARSDNIRGFVGGYEHFEGGRLSKIQSYNNGGLIREYRLNYDEGSASTDQDKISRLTSIEECVDNICSPATRFEWSLPNTDGYTGNGVPQLDHGSGGYGYYSHTIGDINGDGLMDIAWIRTNEVEYAIASTSGLYGYNLVEQTYDGGGTIPVTWYVDTYPHITFIDYNGDGRQDLVVHPLGSQPSRIYLSIPQSDGSWKLSSQAIVEGSWTGKDTIFADIDGDGLQDIVNVRTKTVSFLRSASNPSSETPYEFSTPYPFSQDTPVSVSSCTDRDINRLRKETGDFNGDGRVDFVAVLPVCDVSDPNTPRYEYHLYTSHQGGNSNEITLKHFAQLSSLYSNTIPLDESTERQLKGNVKVVDLDADGLSDVVIGIVQNAPGQIIDGFYTELRFSEGVRLTSPINITGSPLNDRTSFADFNDDGYPDALWPSGSGYQTEIRYWDPQTLGFSNNIKQVAIHEGVNYGDPVRYQDMNGDGAVDFMAVGARTGGFGPKVYVELRYYSNLSRNKIGKIVTGLGHEMDILYEPMMSTEHYAHIGGVKSNTYESYCENSTCWNRQVAMSDSSSFYANVSNPFGSLPNENQVLASPPLYAVFNMIAPIYVVTEVEQSAPKASQFNPGQISVDSKHRRSYFYEQARFQAGGRGFLGFKSFAAVDSKTSMRTETVFRQDWPFIGRPLRISRYSAQNNLISEVANAWGFVDCYIQQGTSIVEVSGCATSKRNTAAMQGSQALGSVQLYMHKTRKFNLSLENNGVWGGNDLSSSEDEYFQDGKGNTAYRRERTWDGDFADLLLDKTTVNQYDYAGPTYSMQMGRLANMLVTSTNNIGSITRESSFTYYTSGPRVGLLNNETIEPNNSEYTSVINHFYDQFGNRKESTVTAGAKTRTGQEVVYDANGRYVKRTLDYFSYGIADTIQRIVTEVVSRDNYGTPTEVRHYLDVDANDYITSITATTAFGTPYFTADSTGASTTTHILQGTDSSSVCQAGLTVTHTRTWAAGGMHTIACRDVLGRVVREGTQGFNGAWMVVDTEHDALGRVVRVSEPYFRSDGPQYWTDEQYDILGRVMQIQHPHVDPDTGSRAITQIEYDVDWIRTTNAKGHIHHERRNALGRVTQTQDALSGNTYFTYDARGNMTGMTDPVGSTTTIAYDLRDRKIAMSDPDKGDWSYSYNAFGELVCQTDAKSQHIIQSYDHRGRLSNRIDYAAGGSCQNPTGSVESNTSWFYDTAAHGMSKIDRIVDSVSGYEKQITYDSLGRPSQTRTRLPGVNNQLEDHFEKITYDEYGRLLQTFDAARGSNDFNHNGIQYTYNSYGYLKSIVDAVKINNVPLETYYTIESMDARGNVIEAHYGNGVMQFADYDLARGLATGIWASNGDLNPIQSLTITWDEVGNLKTRHETGLGDNQSGVTRNLREEFTHYDALNRLRAHQLSGDASGTFSINYDTTGNILSKSDSNNINMYYLYGSDCGSSANAGPHAVCETDGDIVGYSTYQYDNNGNQTAGAGRSISYTVFDKPQSITKGTHISQLFYGPERARYKRIDSNGGQTTATLYVGSVEKVYHADGSIQWERSIGGVAQIIQTVNNAGDIQQEDIYYYLKDHLGSINLITDELGNVVQELDFDPWGRRRNTQTWEEMLEAYKQQNHGIFVKPLTTRGFTGHEALDEVGLIHMNGRIYDDLLGRFVQADPIIQDPFKSQSLNRYSYVWNNPLNATDPSGFTIAVIGRNDPSFDGGETLDEIADEIDQWLAEEGDCGANCRMNLREAANSVFEGRYEALSWLHHNYKASVNSASSTANGFPGTLTWPNGETIPVTIRYTNGLITAVAIETQGGWQWFQAKEFDTRYADHYGRGRYHHQGQVDSFGNTRQSDNQVLYTDERGKTMWVDRDMLTEKILVQNSGRPLSAAESKQADIDMLNDISTTANILMVTAPVTAPVAAPVGAAADAGSAILQNNGEVMLPALVGQAVEMKLKHFGIPQELRTRVGAGVEESLNQATQ